MNINRYNYEEYFLLYTDNELNVAERQAVEQFIEENPDLERELLLFRQTSFRPDDSIVFNSKEILLRSLSGENFINSINCEQLCVLYGDDELTNQEKAGVEQFVYDNPEYQESFELMQSVKLTPDSSITFPNKKCLYRREKNTKPVLFTWWRMAAAAVILLITSTLWLNNTPPVKKSTQIVKADNNKAEKEANITVEDINNTLHKHVIDSTTASSENMVKAVREMKNRKKQTSKAANTLLIQTNGVASINTLDKKSSVTKVISEPKKPVDTQVGDIIKPERVNETIASHEINKSELNNKTIKELPGMKQDVSASSYSNEAVLVSSVNNENVILANMPADRKNSLRGLFRKASRLIDKTTSFRPAKRSGLAIGNIEIAFQ